MKKTYLAGTMSLLLLTTVAQAASSSAELTVVGDLNKKNFCSVSVTSGGLVDLGKIKPGAIQDNTHTTLPSSMLEANVRCEDNTRVTYTVTDNQKGTASVEGNNHYGFGNVNGSGKLGYYTIQAHSGKVNNTNVNIFRSMNNSGLNVFGVPVLDVYNNGYYHGWVDPIRPTEAVSAKDFKVTLYIATYLGSKKVMNGPIADDTTLNGSATFNLFYAI